MYSGKVVECGKNGCTRLKVVLFGKVFVFGQMWLYSGKIVVFGQKWLYLGKSNCNRAKVVVFGQKWLYSGKVVV